ncbi:MAG TPA: hypothetical protein VLH75_00940 [Longimicrobiales bacterium]|nr:hypothetical protein [Longimicrobiales bacterium]
MSRNWTTPGGADDDEARDVGVASALGFLDPASRDPGFWMRFQARVLQGAAPELARRRLMADLTVGDVLTGWARALVPTAVLAAAVAALVLIRLTPAPLPATVEDLLTAGIQTRTIPEALHESEAAASVAFATERF